MQGVPAVGRRRHCHFGKVDRLTILRPEDEKTHGHGFDVTLIEEVSNRGEIAQGFRHFDAADVDHAVVKPVGGQGFARCSFGLGNFIFVVGKGQIAAAAVDVNRVT